VSEASSGKISAENNEKESSKGSKRKSDRSVKLLTGALAKFWVD
jgi:hypothetical protein